MKTGFIGLGAMGESMALNLDKAGLLHGVWNRSPQRLQDFPGSEAARRFDTPETLARECEVVVLCVSADADVLELVERMAAELPKDAVVIDCSTVSAGTARQAAEILAGHGAGFLDCPVSGGTEGAKNATLAIMCGGSPADFDRVKPVLDAMGKRCVLMGEVGAGQATKAVNQIMVAGVNQAVAEGLAFAAAHELDLDKVIDVVGGGAAGSWMLTNRGPNMARGTYPLGFKVSLHDKDLAICQQMAASFDAQLPIIEMTRIHYERLMAAGHGDEDVSSLYRLKQPLFRSDS
ncbi:MAG: NAD(P)-dependent oxidoreductase [Gammaproteobacteria bacterium]|nr:NAD(P)-dependent oxidoreductase [Gammaproteobacteria bacterium]